MSVALQQPSPTLSPRSGPEGVADTTFRNQFAQVAKPELTPLPPVPAPDGRLLGEVGLDGQFVDLTPKPEAEAPAQNAKPAAPLVAPRPQPAQPAPTQQPAQKPASSQPTAPTAGPPAPTQAAPAAAPAAPPPAEARPSAPAPQVETPRPQPQPAPQQPSLPTMLDGMLRVIPFAVPGFGLQRRPETGAGGAKPAPASPGAAPTPATGTTTEAEPATQAAPGAPLSPLRPSTEPRPPAPTQPIAPVTPERPQANPAPQPAPTPPVQTGAPRPPAPVAVPGSGNLPPALDLAPRPPASGTAPAAGGGEVGGVRPLPGTTFKHSSGLTYEIARVDVTPVPGRQLVGSNFPETVQPSTFHDLSAVAPGLRGGTFMSTIEGSQSVKPMALAAGPDGAPQAHTLFWSHQNRQGNQPMSISAAFHNPGTTPITVNLDVAMSDTTKAGYKDLARFPNGGIPPNTEIVLPDGTPNGPGQAASTRRMRGVNDVPPENRTITIPPGETRFVTLQTVPPDAKGRTTIGPEGVGTGTMTVSGGEVQVAMLGTNRPMSALTQEQRERLLETAPFMNRDGAKDLTATPLATMLERGGTFSRLAGIYDAGQVDVKVTNDAAGRVYELKAGQTMVAPIDTKPPHSSVLGPSQSPTIAVEGSQTPGGAVVNGCGYGQMKTVEVPIVNNTSEPLRLRGTWANLVAQTPDSFPTRNTIMTEWQTPSGSGKSEVNLAQSRDTMGKEPLFDIVLMPGESGTVRMKFDSPANVTTPWGPLLTTTAATPQDLQRAGR